MNLVIITAAAIGVVLLVYLILLIRNRSNKVPVPDFLLRDRNSSASGDNKAVNIGGHNLNGHVYLFIQELSAILNLTSKQTLERLLSNDPIDKTTQIVNGSFLQLNLVGKLVPEQTTENPIQSIDKLTCLKHLFDLETLIIGGNQLRELDLSPNTALKKLHIEQLSCDLQLNISNNRSLKNMSGYDHKNSIYLEVYCTENQRNNLFGQHKTGIFSFPDDTNQRHDFVRAYNWDDGTDLLKYVIRHTDTDRSTARMIYWMGQPEWFCQYDKEKEIPMSQLSTFYLLNEIENRVKNDFYNQQTIPFDPRDDQGIKYTSKYPDIEMYRFVAKEMYE